MSVGDVDRVIGQLRAAAGVLRSPTSSIPDELRAAVAARNALDAFITEGLAEVAATEAFRDEDASSVGMWARRELGMESGEARGRVRAAGTMRRLPQVADAFAAGRVGIAQVRMVEFAERHVGLAETEQFAPELLAVAQAGPPSVLWGLVKQFRATVHPDELDRAWLRGMAKRDFQISRVEDGWHLTGYLPIDLGAKIDALAKMWAKPAGPDDRRTRGQRRLDGLDDLATRELAGGLPTDGTVPPQVHVVVDAGTLQAALAPQTESAFTPGDPATLVGFGPIGPQLMRHLTCGAALTPILIDRIDSHTRVLDVGRTQRVATAKQRHAIWLLQEGHCGARGCPNPIDHLHHRTYWSSGGSTDLANLIGLCHACHTQTHARAGPHAHAA